MGDTIDGSSSAAHSAQWRQNSETKRGGFFGLIGSVFGRDISSQPETAPTVTLATDHSTRGMINLRRLSVEDVAIPKIEIVSVPEDIEKDELVQVFRDSGLTRLPVYRETLDQPIGLVHLKDFALRHAFTDSKQEFDLGALLRPLLFVPPSMSIGVLLARMQTERRHMALVIDEYGGVDGLLTIEDLIEQVIGEIEDEHDVDEGKFWAREKPGQYIAVARAPLDEFQNEVGVDFTEHEDIDPEEIDSLGGLVFMLSGRVPVRGEVVKHPCGAEFEILDADPRRIKRLRVILPQTRS